MTQRRPPRRSAGVLLAAGGSRRFRDPRGETTHKLLALHHGRPLWQHSLDHLVDAGFVTTLMVVGAVALDPVPDGVTVVEHRGWAEGQAGSLHAAIRVAADRGVDHVVVGLADQPGVTADAWVQVATAPSSPIVVATYGGARGPNPVRLRADVWPLLPTVGDAGARSVIAAHPELVTTVACIGSAFDIDTWEDLRGWRSC
jgi:molybdenum cofactor cytidylyltransferase